MKKELQFTSDENGNVFYRYCYVLGDSNALIPIGDWKFYNNMNYC